MSKLTLVGQVGFGSPLSLPIRRLSLFLSAAALAASLSACGGGGDSTSGGGNTNTSTCTVSGVTVSANPTSVVTSAQATLTATVNASASCSAAVTWSASPGGGTLTPNGNTASFVSPTFGTYTVTATSTADASKSGSATVTVTVPCGFSNGTVVNHSSDINASETWAGDGVRHVVPSSISVRNNATLTVQACALVELGQRASITVRDSAKLVSAGTSNSRFIFFKRFDPNQPWGALFNLGPTSSLDLNYTVLQGGGDLLGSRNNAGLVMSGAGYGELPAPVLRVNNVTIDSPLGAGLYLDTNAAFTADSQQFFIAGAGDYAVRATMMSIGSLPSGSYVGNAIDEIMVIGPGADVFADMTIHDRGVPVRIQTQGLRVAARAPVTTPVTLTLEPGVVLKFPKMTPTQPGAFVTFGYNGHSPNDPVGVLNAVGTAAKPIVFTSGELFPAPGDWGGIWLDTANGSRLDHVEIAYAGAPSGISSNNCRPDNTHDDAALFVGDFDTQYVPPADLITNSWIHHSAGFGIDAMWLAPSFNSPDLTATNLFENNAMCRQTYNGVTAGSCPATKGCTAN